MGGKKEGKQEKSQSRAWRGIKKGLKISAIVAGSLTIASLGPPSCHAVFSDRNLELRINEDAPIASPTHTVRIMSYNIAHARGASSATKYPGIRDFFDDLDFDSVAEFAHEYGLDCTVSKKTVYSNLDAIAAVITEHQPHVVVLNEIDRKANCSYNIDQVKYLAQKTGMRYYAFGSEWDFYYPFVYNERSGNAVLSKYPMEGEKKHFSKGSFSKWIKGQHSYMEMDIYVGHNRQFTVLGTHLISGSRSKRNAQAQILATRGDALVEMGKDVAIVGDLNSRPPIVLKEEELAVKERVLGNLTDSGNFHIYPGMDESSDEESRKKLITWPKSGKIIDYVVVSKKVSYENCYAPQVKVSDHEPMVCDIHFKWGK